MSDRLIARSQLVVLGVVVLTMAGAAGCSRGVAGSDAAPLPTVAVARVTRGPLSRSQDIEAELRPYQDVDIHAKVAGFVQSIVVDVGDHVREGQVLATLEIPELADEVEQADAGVAASDAEVTRAEAEVARAGSAHDVAHLAAARLTSVSKAQPGLVAQQEIDEATGRDKVAEAQLATANAALAASRQQVAVARANQARTHALFNYASITAPFAGVITKRYADKGTMIQAGTSSTTQALPLVRLAEDDRLRLVIPVPESAVSHIRVGGAVDVRVPSLNRSFSGSISRFADQVDPTTRTMHAEVNVPNPTGTLVPGLYALASIVLDQIPNALTVPAQALDRTDAGVSVLRVGASGVLERRAIRLGLETVDAAEVTSGLSEGDLVVVGTRSQLRPGETVQPKVSAPAGTTAGTSGGL
jgi:RND family efflux transporter MFP subunit